MLPARKRTLLVGGQKDKKRRKSAADEHETGDIDFNADEPAPATLSDDDGDEEVDETAEEKRLRIAKAYIGRLKAAAGSDEDDDDGEGGGGTLSDRLMTEAKEAAGRVQRNVADSVTFADVPALGACSSYGEGRLLRGHRLAATAVCLASDDRTAFTVSKCGGIFQWDVETGVRTTMHRPGDPNAGVNVTGTNPDWVKAKARTGGAVAIYTCAVSSDDRYFAVGGGDNKIHLWDLRSQTYLAGYKGHKALVSGLGFRLNTHQLFSASFDKSVKIWSVDDGAYVDSLFGHQSECTSVDVLRQDRAVSAGLDRTCRVWKIPEEAQMVYRASALATDCVKYVTGTEWLSGNYDGSVALWSQLKKKPIHIMRKAHHDVNKDKASGAGDGLIRLWSVKNGPYHKVLEAKGCLPARGFVNGLAIAKSAKFLVAAMGQEPRLGRWVRDKKARNGLLIHKLDVDSS